MSDTFSFLNQCQSVNTLLQAAVKALPFATVEVQVELESALRTFEHAAVATTWSTHDIDDALGLSSEEKEEAINAFVEHYQITDADWEQVNAAARDVASNKACDEVPA